MIAQAMQQLGSQRSVIRELFEYGNQRAALVGRENVFDFSLGNPSVPAPPSVRRALLELAAEEEPTALHGYTSAPGAPEARAAIAADLNRRFEAGCGPQHLYLTAGAAAALCICFRALACPGDEFLAFSPYFPEYRCFVEQGAGAKFAAVPPDTDQFQIDFSALNKMLTPHTKAVIVNSPNNPSGAVYTLATVKRLAQTLQEASHRFGHPVYLISDEPYREILYDGTAAPFWPRYYRNTLVCYSWSKSLSLPGERIGYVLAPPQLEQAEEVYAAVCGAGRALGYVNAPSLFQRVIARVVGETGDIAAYRRNRDLLLEGLWAAGYACQKPGGAFYLFPAVPGGDDVEFSRRAQKLDVLVVPGSGFGCPGHVRISYCVAEDTIRRALPLFARLMEEYRAEGRA